MTLLLLSSPGGSCSRSGVANRGRVRNLDVEGDPIEELDTFLAILFSL